MDALAWLIVLVLGGFLGMVGQGARAIVGLKKQADAAAAQGQKLADRFSGSTLGISLLIGFVAGVLAIVGLVAAGKVGSAAIDGQTVATLLGAGYAGADFIEGFMQSALPSTKAPTTAGASIAPPRGLPATTPSATGPSGTSGPPGATG